MPRDETSFEAAVAQAESSALPAIILEKADRELLAFGRYGSFWAGRATPAFSERFKPSNRLTGVSDGAGKGDGGLGGGSRVDIVSLSPPSKQLLT